ncbi:NRDE family protein [Aliamphritea ceti]|uniref:NRDE family protein n=1 Tax=Aliamphritea ceti TaxID=1524258 RepID=UPI0021C4AD92|nr:NRDE family protein [Aliamphritea ceti]
MCLIVFAYKQHPEYNLILVANRDEQYERPTQSLHIWDSPTGIIAGRDSLQSGTWLGIAHNGHFSAITNHRNGLHIRSTSRSRGLLTTEFLNSSVSAQHYADEISQTSVPYNGFNLIVADSSGLYHASNVTKEYQYLRSGIYGLSNALLDTDWPKTRQQKQRLKDALQAHNPNPQTLIEMMADPQRYPDETLPDTHVGIEIERALSSSFIQLESYGTRATTVVMQDYHGRTRIIEQNYTAAGKAELIEYELQIEPFGGITGQTEPATESAG